MNENRNNSYLISSKGSSAVLRTCTSCCPFDAKNIPHPYFNYSSINRPGNGININSDACCLSKLQVDCHIQCPKKKKTKRYHSSQSITRSLSSSSSSSQLNPNPKRKKFSSITNTNSHNIQSSSSSLSASSEQSFSSDQSKKAYHKSANAQQYNKNIHINESIQNLKSSIDNLTQLIIHHQNPTFSFHRPISFFDKLRRFFTLFKSNEIQINEECCQILQRNHLTKQNLLSIYNLFDKNEIIFLNWLRTIMPEYILPLLLNYVKHFDSISN